MKKALFSVALASLLVGCSSTTPSVLDTIQATKNVTQSLYLRGDFTLWEAQSAYKLKE